MSRAGERRTQEAQKEMWIRGPVDVDSGEEATPDSACKLRDVRRLVWVVCPLVPSESPGEREAGGAATAYGPQGSWLRHLPWA